MELPDLKLLVAKGEGLTLEFKLRLPDPERIVKETIALANTNGGTILFGVDDNGKIEGLKDPEEAMVVFEESIQKFCTSIPDYSFFQVRVTRKRYVLGVEIRESPNKPVEMIFLEGGRPRSFYRVGEKSIQASRELVEILRHSVRQKNTRFEFGLKEKILMEFLEKNRTITVSELSQIAGIKKFTASRTLVMLTRANVLSISPDEGEDRFSVNQV